MEARVKHIVLFLITAVVFFSTWAYADSEKIEKGIDWLKSQQSVDGSYYSIGGIADALQVTAETVSTLDKSVNASFDKAAATAFVVQQRQSHTEALYWKVLLKSLSNQDANLELRSILLNQHSDGGFGSYEGYDSNPLDTAFALKAISIVDASNSAVISKSISYLLQQQQANGAFKLNNSNNNSVYVTSLVLSALNKLKFHFSISSEIEKSTKYLALELNSDNSQLESWQQALAIIAIRQTTVDATGYKTASDVLFDKQLSNGSWQDDAYTTALILKSSQSVAAIDPPDSVTQASVSGRVLDRKSLTALTSAKVILQSSTDSSKRFEVNTDGQGFFKVLSIVEGDYSLEINAIGYLSISSQIKLKAKTNIALGNVTLEQIPDKGIIKGTVYSAEDGMPLSGVTVSSSSSTVVTNSLGFYQLSSAPGSINISFGLNGYRTIYSAVNIQAGTANTFSPALYLNNTQNKTNLSGRVLDFDTLQLLPGVRVIFNGKEAGITGVNGEFNLLNITSGSAQVELVLEEYEGVSYEISLVENATNNIGDIVIRKNKTNTLTTVIGRVITDTDSNPITGAVIKIPELGLNATSDSNGRYKIEGIAKRSFFVEISANGFKSTKNALDLDIGSVTTINAALGEISDDEPPEDESTASVSGRVIDGQKLTNLRGTQVKLVSHVDQSVEYQVSTNEHGTFQIYDILEGEYKIVFNSIGFLEASANVELKAGINYALGKIKLEAETDKGWFQGTVTSAVDGTALEGALISLSGVSAATTRTDENGRYQLTTTPGDISINISLDRYQTVTAAATIEAGTRVTFSPSLYIDNENSSKKTNLKARVLDFDTMRAVAGVEVKLNDVVVATTNEEGVFEALDVTAGDVIIELSTSEYFTSTYKATLVDKINNNFGDITIRKEPPNSLTTVTGQILDEIDGLPIDGAEIRIPELNLIATSDNEGRYKIEGITKPKFLVEISAVGYFGASSSVDITLGSTLVANAELYRASASGIEINEMRASTGEEYEAYSEVELDVGFLNTSDNAIQVRLYLKVVNSNGDLVEQYPTRTIPMGGSISDAFEILEPGVQTEKEVEWHITDHEAGIYNLIVQAYGQTGELLVERGELIKVLATKRISGHAEFSPPIAQLADMTPINIGATIVNRGNTNIPNQQLTATVTLKNKGYGAQKRDVSISSYLSNDDVKGVYASTVDNKGNYFYLNNSGNELKKRSVDGLISTLISGIPSGRDMVSDENGGLSILTSDNIIHLNSQGEQKIFSLDIYTPIKFAYKGDGKYLIWSTTGLYEFEGGQSSKLLIPRGLNQAKSIVSTNSEELLILDESGIVYLFSEGKLTTYNNYDKRYSKLILVDGHRLIAVESQKKSIYELLPNGEARLIVDGLNVISDIHEYMGGVLISDVGANKIWQLSLDGNLKLLASATYTGISHFAEQKGILYGIRNARELVKINQDKTVEYISTLPSGMRSFVASSDGGFISSHFNTIYRVQIDGSYEEVSKSNSIISLAKESKSGIIYFNTKNSLPINKLNSTVEAPLINEQFYRPTAFSKVPNSDSVLVLSGNGDVFRVTADLHYQNIGRIPFVSYESLYALNQSEFIAGDYSGQRLVKFNSDGSNETLADLDFRPKHIASDSNGNLYISEYSGNRVYKWNKKSGLSLYKTLSGTIYYGFTVNPDGEIFYARSNRYIYKHTDKDESLGRPIADLNKLSWSEKGLLATGRGEIKLLEVDGSFTTLVNSGAIENESTIFASYLADKNIIAFTGASDVILYDTNAKEKTVASMMDNTIRDFHVRDEGTYVLDSSGRIGLFEEYGKFARLLYSNSAYNKIDVLDSNLILAHHSNGVDKINVLSGEKTQLLTSIDSRGGSVVRTNDTLEVFDINSGLYASVSIYDGELIESYYDVKSPSLIAADNQGNIYAYQNTDNIYRLIDNKFEYVNKLASPNSFKYLNGEFVVVKDSVIYKSKDLGLFTKVADLRANEQKFKDIATVSEFGFEAITSNDVVISDGTIPKYYGFSLGDVTDIDVANTGEVLFSTKKRLVGFSLDNKIKSYPYAFSDVKALEIMMDGSIALLDNKILYSLNLDKGTFEYTDTSLIQSGSVYYDELYQSGKGLILQSYNSIDYLSIDVIPDSIDEGEVVYRASLQYPGTLKGSPALKIKFDDWMPTQSGDYEINISSDDPTIGGKLINKIHVGPLAKAIVSTSQVEIMPGNQTLLGRLNILGADTSSITTINEKATSLAASSYTYGRAIAADSFGNIYAGDSSRIKIISPKGDVSDFVTGSLGIKNGMAVDDQNNIYAGTANGILKVTHNKEISFNKSIGAVNAVTISKNNMMYAATNFGVYKLEDRETPVLMATTGLKRPQAIAVDAYDNVYVLNNDHRISRIHQDGSVSDYYTEATFEYEGVNLVADCSRNLIFAPMTDRVAKPRYSEEDSIVQLMADTRESRLVLKGDLYDRALSDIDVLYYDRFGDRFLIWTDQSAGKIFSFPVICGGINVELHVTTRTDVDVVFEDLLPDEIVELNGKQELKWTLKNVDVNGVEIPIQFALNNMKEGETRPVFESGFLRFKNSFDADNPIDLPLKIPTIHSITRVVLTGNTDKATYLANSDVNISLDFINQSAGSLSGEIHYGIYDKQGNTVYEYPSVIVADQVPQDNKLIQSSWNTANTIAGGYLLKAHFNNSQGELVEAIEYPFAIVNSQQAGSLGYSSQISTDKLLYNKGETAVVSTRIINTSVNTIAEKLIAEIRLQDVSGNIIASVQQSVQALYPNGIHAKETPVVLSSVAAGNYQAKLIVIDSTTGLVQDTKTYEFVVDQGGVAGSGLSSTVRVLPEKVTKGHVFSCQYTVNNIGTAATGATNIRSFVVYAANDNMFAIHEQSINLAAGSSENLLFKYTTQNLELGGYACVLQASLQGQWTTLSSNGVLVREDPVLSLLDANVQAANDEVYFGESASCIDTVNYIADSGNVDVNLIQNLVRIDTAMIQDSATSAVMLTANQTEILSRRYSAQQLALGEYRCELIAQRNGSEKLIAHDTFAVIEPPVKVSTSLINGEQGRLLVLTDAVRQCSALEDIHVKVNWEGEFASDANLTIKVFDEDGALVDTEVVNQWGIQVNANQPMDADLTVQASHDGSVQLSLSSPNYKLGKHYRVEVKAEWGWLGRKTKSWDMQTDCDRPFTVGEIIEDVHLLGYKWHLDPNDSVKDIDPYGPLDAPKVEDQNTFIQEQFDSRGWNYTLVHSAARFTDEMRNGDYAAYVILSERAHLPILAQKEIREHVFAGKGLLVGGSHDKRNLFIEPALGLTVTARHPWASGLLDETNAQSEAFPFVHLVQTASLHGAQVEAQYSLAADGLSDADLQQGWENLHDAIPLFETMRNYRRRAVMTMDYGLGQSAFMGYDVLAVATQLGEGSQSAQLLFDQIDRVASVQPQALAYKEWPLIVTINNEGSAISGIATLTLPAGMELVSSGDFEKDGQVWTMSFALDDVANTHNQYQKTVYVRLPEGDGAQLINLYVDAYGANGGQANVEASLSVSSTAAASVSDLTGMAHNVKLSHWYEPHFYILYADLKLAKHAIENQNWHLAQALLIGATNLILLDTRDDVVALRLAIDEQIRLIGKQL